MSELGCNPGLAASRPCLFVGDEFFSVALCRVVLKQVHSSSLLVVDFISCTCLPSLFTPSLRLSQSALLYRGINPFTCFFFTIAMLNSAYIMCLVGPLLACSQALSGTSVPRRITCRLKQSRALETWKSCIMNERNFSTVPWLIVLFVVVFGGTWQTVQCKKRTHDLELKLLLILFACCYCLVGEEQSFNDKPSGSPMWWLCVFCSPHWVHE